jgi:FlaA1/EpsC-like NDP-sugar epimerase
MSASQVANFVISAAKSDTGGLKIPEGIKASTVNNLIRATASFCGVEKYEIEEIGIRPGEKLHETLMTDEEGGAVVSDDRLKQFEFKSLERFLIDTLKDDT